MVLVVFIYLFRKFDIEHGCSLAALTAIISDG